MTTRRLKSLTEGLPPLYWLLWTGTLINRLGGFVIPFLTLYLTGERGVPVSQAALMVSLFGAGSFIAQLTGGEVAASAVAPAIIADLSPVELRGLYQGIYGSAWGLSFFIGPVIGGWVYEHLGPGRLWLGCLLLGVLLSGAYLSLTSPAKVRMAKASGATDDGKLP